MLDFYWENCLILEAVRDGISQQAYRHLKQNLLGHLVGPNLAQFHVFLEFSHYGLSKLLKLNNLELF
jgi:hypothetical protein